MLPQAWGNFGPVVLMIFMEGWKAIKIQTTMQKGFWIYPEVEKKYSERFLHIFLEDFS